MLSVITIAEPKEYIASLWGKQKIKENETYRLMKYVLQVNHDGKVLLHNVVTGQLVVLVSSEVEEMQKLPIPYTSKLDQLVEDFFLVPISFNENEQVDSLRKILRTLDEAQKPRGVIRHYTILPTTACNARCYYCFEQGSKVETMTETTANNVVDFISSHCDDSKRVQLSWFGGEPTVAAHRIDQICSGLQKNGITYQSDITTNGYLLDEDMIEKAINLWKLDSCMICVDGIENTYNKVKSYISSSDSAYKRVMRNIGILLNSKVRVNLRMNFDLENYLEFSDLVKEVLEHFGKNKFLQVYAHPIFGEHRNANGKVVHATNEWFTNKVVELNNFARDAGLLRSSIELPSIEFRACQASGISSAGIGPNGSLIRCPERFGEDEETGNVIEGITNPERLESWSYYVNLEMCKDCVLFPICQRNARCMARDVCCYRSENLQIFKNAIIYSFENSLNEEVM